MRKLAIIAVSFSLAILISNYISSAALLWLAAVLYAAAAMLLVRYTRLEKKLYAVLIAAFLFGLLVFSYNSSDLDTVDEFDGKIVSLSAVIEDYPEQYDNYSRIRIKLNDGELKGFRSYLYDYYHIGDEFVPGDCIRFNALVNAVSEEQDTVDSYLSSGILIKCRLASDIVLFSHRNTIQSVSSYIRRFIIECCDDVFPENSGFFYKALLAGDRRELFDNSSVYQSMSKSGIIHIVAVSGMHVSILAGFFLTVFGRSKNSSIICILFLWCFVFITGCSYSTERAALMQTVLLLAPVFKRENDVLTSLSFALAILLAINPYAIRSISLQLSFAATAGICVFNSFLLPEKRENQNNSISNTVFRYVSSVTRTSLSAMVFTLPLSGIYFGFISLLSPVTNLLVLWVLPICIYLGLFSVFIYCIFPPVGLIVGKISGLIVRYILEVCKWISGVSFSCIYIKGFYSFLPFAMIYIGILIVLISEFKVYERLLLSFVYCSLCVCFYFAFLHIEYSIPESVITVINVGQGECITVYADGRCVVIDCGTDSTDKDAGQLLLDSIRADGITHIDALCLSHYHEDHMNGLRFLADKIPISSYIFPGIAIPEDNTYLTDIMDNPGTIKYIVYNNAELTVGNLELQLFPPMTDSKDVNENCMSVFISDSCMSALITGDSPSTVETEMLQFSQIRNTDIFVAGHHGSETSNTPSFLEYVSPEYAVVSVGRNSFGHPSEKVLKNLSEISGYLFRTDLNGSVRFIHFS